MIANCQLYRLLTITFTNAYLPIFDIAALNYVIRQNPTFKTGNFQVPP